VSDEPGRMGDLPPVSESASTGERPLGGAPATGFGSGMAADDDVRRPGLAIQAQADDNALGGSEVGGDSSGSAGSEPETSPSVSGHEPQGSFVPHETQELAASPRSDESEEAQAAASHEPSETESESAIRDEAKTDTAANADAEAAMDAETDEDEELDEEDLQAEDEGVVEDVEPIELIDESVPAEEAERNWYILKVQVNREESIREAMLRRVKLAGLEQYFGDVVVPTEDVVEFTKTGKKRVVKKKLFPGYIVVDMVLNDDTWFLVRETPGIGDFTGSAGKPTPMLPHEVSRIIRRPDEEGAEGPKKMSIPFKPGNRVRVKEGYFQNFEGDVESIDEANGRVTVMINIFGRSTPVELEHWQVEAL